MPKRTDLKSILLIGSGPIVIGQGAEFDYSGTQAVRALKEEGYRVILVNSNPATIMTDPELADRTYVEPVTPEWVTKVIERERPDALLPTMGGQTALNVAMALIRRSRRSRSCGVELIGANERAIRIAEDRAEFAQGRRVRIGLETPAGSVARLESKRDSPPSIAPAIRQSSGHRSRWVDRAAESRTIARRFEGVAAGGDSSSRRSTSAMLGRAEHYRLEGIRARS